jgi:hypothetical protein
MRPAQTVVSAVFGRPGRGGCWQKTWGSSVVAHAHAMRLGEPAQKNAWWRAARDRYPRLPYTETANAFADARPRLALICERECGMATRQWVMLLILMVQFGDTPGVRVVRRPRRWSRPAEVVATVSAGRDDGKRPAAFGRTAPRAVWKFPSRGCLI